MPTAVVTGASRGLGRAFARMLADEGYDLVLAARTRDDLESLAAEVPTEVLSVELDVTEPEQFAALRDRVAERFGAVDVLVANAGVGAFAPVADFEVDVFDRLFAVNVRGVFLTLQAFTPALREAASGLAVVVSSDVSTRVFPGGGPYAATKYAVRALSRAFQMEQPDLRVLELRPGATDTHFGDTREGDAGPGHLTADEVAEALRAVLRLPPHVRPEELVVRSTGQTPEF
jgi:3-oxoacyl-[acyl-carrier protein] reductase